MWLSRVDKISNQTKTIFECPLDSKGSIIHTLHVQNTSSGSNSEVVIIIQEHNQTDKDFVVYNLSAGEYKTFPKSINMAPGDKLKVKDDQGDELSTVFLSIYHCVTQEDEDNIYHVPVLNGPNSANYDTEVEYTVSNPQPGAVYYWTFDYSDEPDVSLTLISSASVNDVNTDIVKLTDGNITTLEAPNLTDITVKFIKSN